MLTVVANRLPIERTESGWAVSPGGLVSALDPVLAERGGVWVGWPGDTGDIDVPGYVDELALRAVEIRDVDRDEYYAGFANETLWPLFHDKIIPPKFHRHWYRTYAEVNRRFARRTAEAAPSGSTVWIHDYHLTLVPAMLRELRDDVRIGFFLHIPFPPMELFAQLPWRRALLEGMLGADAVGFQTAYGAQNFRAVARRYAGAEVEGAVVRHGGREVRAEAHPISIDARAFADRAASPETVAQADELRAQLGGRTVLLGVDRLDYTKGIAHRLRALETLLDRRADLAERIVFVQVAVPSREDVAGYAEMREEIEHQIGRINGKHARLGLVPVNYRYGSVERADLISLYRAADVMVVTPLRDGMNLVAKEYVATRVADDGVLVLSEFAGAALELDRALHVNPYDLDGIANTLERALAMPVGERAERMRAMRRHVLRHDVHRWARRALASIERGA